MAAPRALAIPASLPQRVVQALLCWRCLQGWRSDDEGDEQLADELVKNYHFGGGLFERKQGGGDGQEDEEEGGEEGRAQKKSKKEVGDTWEGPGVGGGGRRGALCRHICSTHLGRSSSAAALRLRAPGWPCPAQQPVRVQPPNLWLGRLPHTGPTIEPTRPSHPVLTPPPTPAQVMAEIIAKSKAFKAEKQRQKEEDQDETDALDDQFRCGGESNQSGWGGSPCAARACVQARALARRAAALPFCQLWLCTPALLAPWRPPTLCQRIPPPPWQVAAGRQGAAGPDAQEGREAVGGRPRTWAHAAAVQAPG